MEPTDPALPDDAVPLLDPGAVPEGPRSGPLLDPDAVPEGHRSGYVALVGAPNVGKSTLLNALLGQKLSIVADRPSTTRHRVLGILSEPAADPPFQAVFLDTPGVVRPRYRLHELMMHDVDRALADADLTLFLVDAAEDATYPSPSHDARGALERVGTERPALLVLNKMDLIRQDVALPLVERYQSLRAFDEVLPVSAKTGAGLDRLLQQVVARLPFGPPYYPPDQLSEHPERFFVSEFVREAIFRRFRDEVPYSTQVNVVTFEARERGKDFVDCEIVVEKETQKAILIGKGGAALKALGADARREIETFTGRPVYLQLHVKTRADWRNRDGYLRSYGYS